MDLQAESRETNQQLLVNKTASLSYPRQPEARSPDGCAMWQQSQDTSLIQFLGTRMVSIDSWLDNFPESVQGVWQAPQLTGGHGMVPGTGYNKQEGWKSNGVWRQKRK